MVAPPTTGFHIHGHNKIVASKKIATCGLLCLGPVFGSIGEHVLLVTADGMIRLHHPSIGLVPALQHPHKNPTWPGATYPSMTDHPARAIGLRIRHRSLRLANAHAVLARPYELKSHMHGSAACLGISPPSPNGRERKEPHEAGRMQDLKPKHIKNKS